MATGGHAALSAQRPQPKINTRATPRGLVVEQGDTPLGRYGGVRPLTYVIIVSGFTGDVLDYSDGLLYIRLYCYVGFIYTFRKNIRN